MRYNEAGEEILDDTPVEVPLHLRRRRPPSIQELIAMHVRAEAQVARAMGEDNEEDFEEEEERDDVLTPYELHAYAAEADQEIRSAELAQKLVEERRKTREKRAGGKAGEGKKESEEVGRAEAVRSESKGLREAGPDGAKDDRGSKEGAGG